MRKYKNLNVDKYKDGLSYTSSPSFWVGVLFFSGVIQYLPSSFAASGSSEIFWSQNADVLESSGYFRYVKDISLIVFGVFWPIKIYKYALRINSILLYAVWLSTLVLIGIVPYIFEITKELTVIPAGFRWILLLHCSVGVYLLACHQRDKSKSQYFMVIVLLGLVIVDLIAAIRQISSIGGIAQGMRVPGVFSVAGTAGYFAASVAIILPFLIHVKLSLRVLLYILVCVVAISSGTRFAIISIAISGLFWLDFHGGALIISSRSRGINVKKYFGIAVFSLAASISVVFSGRGNPFDQTDTGGRVSNLAELINSVSDAPIIEVLIGNGIGIGTNSGFTLTFGENISRWHFLIDNTIATTFFQVGIFGLLFLFISIYYFIRSNLEFKFKVIVIIGLSLITQNLFEQYFLMIAFAMAMGIKLRGPIGLR